MALTQSPPDVDARRGTASSERDRDRTVVWLRGEHDISTRSELSHTLARAIALDNNDLVVDLSDVEFLDASTIGVLVATRDFLGARSRGLTLRSPSTIARRLVDLCDLSDLVEPNPIEISKPTAALGTWVAVPATQRVDQRAAPSSSEPDPSAGPVAATVDPTTPRQEPVGIAPRSAEPGTHHVGRRRP